MIGEYVRKYIGRSFGGDVFEITCTNDGGYLCPVCATQMCGEPPWHCGGFDEFGVFDKSKDVLDYAKASFSICSRCRTEYGLDDCVVDFGGLTQMDVWTKLREEWLERTGRQKEDVDRIRAAFGK
jgi:hypothetical protein